jgi:hypothetical protein
MLAHNLFAPLLAIENSIRTHQWGYSLETAVQARTEFEASGNWMAKHQVLTE